MAKAIPAVALMRRKSLFPSSRAAWASIAKSTGLRPSQVRAKHSDACWRWELKSAAPKKKTAAKKKATTTRRRKKTAVKKKTTTTRRRKSPAAPKDFFGF